jgi:hypothetical protein
LALGLNVMVGYTGLVHLGIAAFFGIGAYVMAILTVPMFPFQIGLLAAAIISVLVTAGVGLALGAPTLRLRGDYLAIVTLGFGEVAKVTLRNLEQITGGMKGLNPVPPPGAGVTVGGINLGQAFAIDPRWFYYLTLLLLAGVVVAMRRLENSRLGRAWMAVREDELAASAMGISATRVKLSAFAMSSAVAGLAAGLVLFALLAAGVGVWAWLASRRHESEEERAIRVEVGALRKRLGICAGDGFYLSYEAGPAHVISISSFYAGGYGAGSSLTKWLVGDLASIDRAKTPWVLVSLHAPWYNSNTAHQGDGEKQRVALEALTLVGVRGAIASVDAAPERRENAPVPAVFTAAIWNS